MICFLRLSLKTKFEVEQLTNRVEIKYPNDMIQLQFHLKLRFSLRNLGNKLMYHRIFSHNNLFELDNLQISRWTDNLNFIFTRFA